MMVALTEHPIVGRLQRLECCYCYYVVKVSTEAVVGYVDQVLGKKASGCFWRTLRMLINYFLINRPQNLEKLP